MPVPSAEQSLLHTDVEFVAPTDMLHELMEDNKVFSINTREAHEMAANNNGSETTSCNTSPGEEGHNVASSRQRL
jgi:hypothetical protein